MVQMVNIKSIVDNWVTVRREDALKKYWGFFYVTPLPSFSL